MIVLDASAAVDLLLQIQPNASVVGERLNHAGESLHTPAIFDAEVLQVLRRYSLRRLLTASRARQAFDDLTDLRIIRYPYVPLLGRMWDLRNNLSAFDAAYITLAEALDAPLVTTDTRLARAPLHRAQVESYSLT
ncbi:MAG: type II toxin-antitoxin system VapC family toxin [Actinobacteria bacterium]|nr:type II toxin-antitoxin system VapC family toxin [Actinomycetota bacterium]